VGFFGKLSLGLREEEREKWERSGGGRSQIREGVGFIENYSSQNLSFSFFSSRNNIPPKPFIFVLLVENYSRETIFFLPSSGLLFIRLPLFATEQPARISLDRCCDAVPGIK